MNKKFLTKEESELFNHILIPVCGLILTCLIAWSAYSESITANQTLKMSELAQPIAYTVTFQDIGTKYHIQEEDGRETTVPAWDPVVAITNGALKTLTAMSYDGENLYFITTFENTPIQKDYTITIKALFSGELLVANRTLYDYLFLYIEPVEGAPTLDLVCTEIDLDNGAILRTYKLQKFNLLELESNPNLDTARRQMLEAYQKLFSMMADIQALTNLLQ